jgi:alanyl aminopeptidase
MPVAPRHLAGLLIALLIAGCSADDGDADPGQRAGQPAAVPEGPLPTPVEPLAYELELNLDPELDRFSGRVAIRLRLTKPLDRFWMHGRDLEVSAAFLKTDDGESVPAAYEQRHRDGIVLVTLDRELEPQEATLTIAYGGRLAGNATGLFRSAADGEFYIFSEFQPIQARSAFPGFDEPRFKTPFTISIVTPGNNEAFSNAPEIALEQLDDGRKRVSFAPTQPLPTYLVAFAVGPLDVVEWEPVPANAWRDEPLALRGLAARGKGESLSFALGNTAGMLQALEDYFESPYPYAKLDLVAAVGYSGAMEHAGLITYGEYTLLLDGKASLARQQSFGSTHAHELAHQWLGNLVTMAWWDDLWMNESFATWMQARIVARWRPDMHPRRSLLASTHRAMDRDSLASSRRVREPVGDAAGMFDAFDSATYSKGAAVIRMVEDYVTEDAFRAALNEFLRRFAHRSATAFDLVDTLEAELGAEARLQDIFRTFLFQPGVPYVTASLSCEEGRGRIGLTQARYVPEGSLAAPEGSWAVPVCIRMEGDEDADTPLGCRLLSDPTAELDLGKRCPGWVMPNRGASGYYRWQASPGDADLLEKSGDVLDDLERMALADSLAARMLAGDLGADDYLAAVPVLASALERSVVTSPLDELEWILDHVVSAADLDAARAFLGAIYRRRLEFVDLPGGAESEVEARRLRASLIRFLAGVVRDPEIRRRLAAEGRAYVGFGGDGEIHRGAVDPDLADTAVSIAARDSGTVFFDHLVGMLETEWSPGTRSAIVTGIGSVREPLLLARARNLLLDDLVLTNEVPVLLAALSTADAIEGTWNWVEGNVDRLMSRYPGGYANWMPAHFDSFCSRQRAEDLGSTFDAYVDSVPGIERTIGKTQERILICAAIRSRNAIPVSGFLNHIGREADGES